MLAAGIRKPSARRSVRLLRKPRVAGRPCAARSVTRHSLRRRARPTPRPPARPSSRRGRHRPPSIFSAPSARAARSPAAGHLPVQRRPRLGLGLAAHGRVRPEPRRDPSDGTDDGAPPYPIVDNPDSLLDVTDLVFIDPLGTGFSHLLGETDPSRFYGITEDAQSVAQFIRLWLNDNGRWKPQISRRRELGTTRSAAVVNQLEGHLQRRRPERHHPHLDRARFRRRRRHAGQRDDPHPQPAVDGGDRALSRQGAGALGPSSSSRRRAASRSALCPRTAQGRSFPPRSAPRSAPSCPLHRPLRDLSRTRRPRVTPDRFYKELLRDRGLTVGRLDARYTGRDYDNAGETPDNDPSFFGIDAGYTAAVNQHLRETLGFGTDRDYVTIGQVGPWDWRLGGGATTTSTSTSRPISAGRCARMRPAGCSSARAITISHALLRRRICAEPHRHPARPGPLPILRLGPHDVRARRGPVGAEPRLRAFMPQGESEADERWTATRSFPLRAAAAGGSGPAAG